MGNEYLPDAGDMTQAHRMATAVPGVELADHAHPARIRRPDREAHAIHAGDRAQVRAEHGVGPRMAAVAQGGQLGVIELWPERIGVRDVLRAAIGPAHAQAIGEVLAPARHAGLEQAVGVAAFERHEFGAAARVEQDHRLGLRQQNAGPQPTLGVGMQAEHGERVGVAAAHKRIHRALGDHGRHRMARSHVAAAEPSISGPRAAPRCGRGIARWCGQWKSAPCRRC